MATRVRWQERGPRPGWDVYYTPIGARSRGEDISSLSANESLLLRRIRSQSFVATTTASETSDNSELLYFCSVARKIIQRGETPPLPQDAERKLKENCQTLQATALKDLQPAMTGMGTSTELSQTITFDSKPESDFWDYLNSHFPALSRFITPQASFENLLGTDTGDEESRRVDFLLHLPHPGFSTKVLELDGGQHIVAAEVDKDRDDKLAGQHIEVRRFPLAGDKWKFEIRDLIQEAASELSRHAFNMEQARSLYGASAVARMAFALIELLMAGHIQPRCDIVLHLEDDLDIAGAALQPTLNFLHNIEKLWDIEVLPRHVSCREQHLTLKQEGYVVTSTQSDGKPIEVRICLEQFTAPHAVLPKTKIPTCVIRGANIPVDLDFLPFIPAPRRFLKNPDDSQGILESLMRDIFGHPQFRENQAEAITLALSGKDSLVLLPTGTGKSLIYQMVGLLQPGTTIVVDPLVALINDQVRRLSEDGIDRAQGIHQATLKGANVRDTMYSTIAAGNAIFVLLAPERLQNQEFRDAISKLVETRIVNTAVLDEAHCISEWGHDFRTAYLNVARNLRHYCLSDDRIPPNILALTGTASPAVLRDVIREIEDLEREIQVVRPDSYDRPNLHYQISIGSMDDVKSRLTESLTRTIPDFLGLTAESLIATNGSQTSSGLVFVPVVKGAKGIEKTKINIREAFAQVIPKDRLKSAREIAGIYSGSAPTNETGWDAKKAQAAEDFVSNRTPILVSTKAFGMGIDKPNIRWTLHLGYPSSLEAFAQEAGRAGRDKQSSICIIVASPALHDEAQKVLDLRVDTTERKSRYESLKFKNRDDLFTQLYFHQSSFIGVPEELTCTMPLLQKVIAQGPQNDLVISFGTNPATTKQGAHESNEINIHGNNASNDKHKHNGNERAEDDSQVLEGAPNRTTLEKAVFRLSMLGLIDDYTIEHGSKKLTLELSKFDNAHIDGALLQFLRKLEPGAYESHIQKVALAPADFAERAKHHLEILIQSLYNTIEPARIRALTEIQQLCATEISPEGVRARILAYLSGGPLATALEEIAEAENLVVEMAISNLDAIPSVDPDEWIGAAARQLETYPDNPLLLAARSIGENARRQPDIELLSETLNAAFIAMPKYQIDEISASQVLTWLGDKFQGQLDRPIDEDMEALSNAWENSGFSLEPLLVWEQEIFNKALTNDRWHKQLLNIARRRFKRNFQELSNLVKHLKE